MTKKTLGTTLLLLGISAWGVFYGLKAFTVIDPPFRLFLTWHLLGVIPGALLRGSKLLGLLKKAACPSQSEEPAV